MNIVEQVTLWHSGASDGYMSKSGIAGSSGRCISNLRKLQIAFHSDCTSLQYHHQWSSVARSPHPLQHMLSSVIFGLGHYDLCKMEPQGCFDLHFSYH